MKSLSLLALCVALAAPAIASAQSNSAQAERLFRDGKSLMTQKKYGEACEAFDASQKLDPQATTLMNLADCREKNNQLATAWGLFLDVERMTRSDKANKALGASAQQRAQKIEPLLSYLIINVPDESRVDGLTITRNGDVIDPGTWNRALPVDGGDYVIEGKAPGHEPWSTHIVVGSAKDKQSVDVPKFKAMPLPDPNTVKPNGNGNGNGDDDLIDTSSGGMSGKRKAAIGVGAGGVVLLALSGYFELTARGKYDDSVAEVDDMKQDELFDEAVKNRKLAIGVGIAGGVCVGAAAFLWFTGGSSGGEDSQALRILPAVGPDQVGIAFGGGF